jgi:LacI family transcriptional regulator
MHVPYDLSIAGFEDSPFSKQSWPTLTTARQATEEIARHAAYRLIAELRRDGDQQAEMPANEGFSPILVVRGSTAPPRPLAGA